MIWLRFNWYSKKSESSAPIGRRHALMDFSSLSMLMASHPHCLRRFYHARAVTGRKYHCEVHRHQPIQPARCTCCMSIDRSPFARVVAYLLLSRFPITYRNAALFDYQGTKKGLTGFPARSDLRSHGCERADDAAKHVRIRAYHRFLKINKNPSGLHSADSSLEYTSQES